MFRPASPSGQDSIWKKVDRAAIWEWWL